MKIRFMCLKHYCDLMPEGMEDPDYEGPIDAITLYSQGDGTYEFDFSAWNCPEFDVIFSNAVDNCSYDNTTHELTPEVSQHIESVVCSESWTAVIYSNFTKIGDDNQKYTYNQSTNQIEKI